MFSNKHFLHSEQKYQLIEKSITMNTPTFRYNNRNTHNVILRFEITQFAQSAPPNRNSRYRSWSHQCNGISSCLSNAIPFSRLSHAQEYMWCRFASVACRATNFFHSARVLTSCAFGSQVILSAARSYNFRSTATNFYCASRFVYKTTVSIEYTRRMQRDRR